MANRKIIFSLFSLFSQDSFIFNLRQGAYVVNFCRTFVWSISLFLELAGSNLAQTLLNPPKVVRLWLYL